VERGFWTVLDYWLERTEEFLSEQWVANRVAMIGRYDTGLGLRRPIDRFMRSEDPYGTLEVAERFQDALGSEELDPGLVHRHPFDPERREQRIREFVALLRGGIAAR
jgi:hypothetical protein